ncbi:hypothetical protein I4U23_011612 [Adineta vaga]|nr:hypothetical protein I4U23_011612 [Adineta vaga]
MIGLIVGIVVILSLIPTYLSTKNLAGINTNSFTVSLAIIYKTSFKSIDSSSIPNQNLLLMKEYPLTYVNVFNMKFISTSLMSFGKTRRETASTNDPCIIDSSTANDLMSMNVLIEYRSSCHPIFCQKKFNETVERIMETLKLNITLPVTLTNSSIVTVQLVFCSFAHIQSGE